MIENDEVRGLGFVTLHSVYLETRIHELLLLFSPIEAYPEEHHTWPIDRKIKQVRKRLKKLDSEILEELRENLNECKIHFVWRNDLVHSVMCSTKYLHENLVSAFRYFIAADSALQH